jgi:hypothetical protein
MPAQELAKTILANSANLKGYWRFESGALTTDTQGTHTLTAISDPALGTGVFGGCADFDGNDAYSAVDHADWRPTGSYSVGAWFKCSSAVDGAIISNANINTGDYSGWELDLAPDGDLIVAHYPTNGGTTESAFRVESAVISSYSSNTWHHIVFTFNGTTGRIYYDGKMVGAAAMSPPAYDATNPPRIGCRVVNGANASIFTGSLDDVFLINGTALSADQIKELFEGRIYGELRPNQFGTTVGLWHLNGNSTDFSGNNNHGSDTAITYSAANGKLGQGAGFNGSSSIMNLVVGSSLNFANDVTICYWLKYANSGVVINRDTGGFWEFISRVSVTNKTIGFDVQNTSNAWLSIVSDNNSLPNAVWNFIALQKTATSLNIYINGALAKTGSFSGTGRSLNRNIVLGRRMDVEDEYLDGQIDEVSFHSTALTANQIRQIYAYQKGLLGRYA